MKPVPQIIVSITLLTSVAEWATEGDWQFFAFLTIAAMLYGIATK